jgi:hypothetical protein
VGNNKKLNYNYELWFLALIIIFAIVLLFILIKPTSKKIYELKNLENGNYLITGFVSDLQLTENYIKFKLADSTDSILVFGFHKFTDINNGIELNIICKLQSNKYGKECLID